MLRSAYLAQELLTTFDSGEIREVALAPQYGEPGGVFVVTVDDAVVWDRSLDGGFPETKVLKQRVRDRIAPDRNLGHSDVAVDAPSAEASAAEVLGAVLGGSAEATTAFEEDWLSEVVLESDTSSGAPSPDATDAPGPSADVAAQLKELEKLTSLGRDTAVKLLEKTLSRPDGPDPQGDDGAGL